MEGEPEVVLADYIAKNWSDLIVAGTHGRSAIEHDTIGSVAERFLTTLVCDVLAVPTRK
jgi:nucleotide-binding universal stress UspA family protein